MQPRVEISSVAASGESPVDTANDSYVWHSLIGDRSPIGRTFFFERCSMFKKAWLCSSSENAVDISYPFEYMAF